VVFLVVSKNAIAKQRKAFRYALVSVDSLKLHEHHIAKHLEELEKEILNDGVIKRPIIVEKTTLTVLDGTHRVTLARKLGFKKIPALLISYELAEIRSWAHIYEGFCDIGFFVKSLVKLMKTSDGEHGNEEFIVKILNSDGDVIDLSFSNIYKLYWTIHFLDKFVKALGCEVSIIPDTEVETYTKNPFVAIIPPPIPKSEVLRVVREGKRFPPKSTRHVLKIQLSDVNVPLKTLYDE